MSNKPAVGTSVRTPNTGAQGTLFNNLWGDTSNVVGTAVNQPIPQNTVAPATTAQRTGAQEMLDVAPTLGGGAQPTQDFLKKVASGYFSNPWNDPNFGGSVSAALTPSINALQGTILPGITDTSLRASGAGTGPAAYGGVGGGSPQDINTERALRDWSVGAQNTGATMAENAYRTGLGLTGEIPALAQSATSQALTPAATTEAAGGLQQGFNQGGLQNIINEYFLKGQGPLGFLSSAANIGGAGGFGSTTNTGPAPNMMTQWLQGLTGGAAGANSLFGSGPGGSPSAFGNIYSGLGSLLGGAGAGAGIGAETVGAAGLPALGTAAEMLPFLAMSDERMKKDISKIGRLRNGTNVYQFRYRFGDSALHLGVLAQEVEKANPSAVHEISGIKFVDYAKVLAI